MNTIDISHAVEIYSVSRLNREVRLLLESNFQTIWLEGEISNFAAPQSGHWYFSLKDATAQVRCAMFKPQNRKIPFYPQDGMHVLVQARISLYEGRGDFQLLVEYMEEAGEGKLRQAFEALKKRLFEKGLFDTAHKKPIPYISQSLGIITSPTGAAIRDILTVLKRRFPYVPVIVYPTLVQGEAAALQIVNAIQTANRRAECDVLILARGGGSLEDLWPFNEESVAQAIFDSRIPIISGVGHEIDFTIADFVADLRAPTPSAAAELASIDCHELLQTLHHQFKQLTDQIKQKFHALQQHILWMRKHLQHQHPKRKLTQQIQQLDLHEMTLIRLQTQHITSLLSTLHTLHLKLSALTPAHLIRELRHHLHLQQHILKNRVQEWIQRRVQTVIHFAATLDALSPLATLNRGFSITTSAKNHRIIRQVAEVKSGEKIHVQLTDGTLACEVEDILISR